MPEIGLLNALMGCGFGLLCTPCSAGTYGLMAGSSAVVLRAESADMGVTTSIGL